jgi:hypothetical protein
MGGIVAQALCLRNSKQMAHGRVARVTLAVKYDVKALRVHGFALSALHTGAVVAVVD